MRRQLAHLLWLRRRMVRSRRRLLSAYGVALAVLVLSAAAAVAARAAPADSEADLLLLAPTALIPIAALSVLGPLAVGGGNQLFPREQLVAFPVTARTQHDASLVLTPLNVAWTTQVVGLVALASYLSLRSSLVVAAVATVLSYVAMVTVAGQALAWWVVGVRHRPGGRVLTTAAAGVLLAGGFVVLVTGQVADLLDRSPTVLVVIASLDGSSGDWLPWAIATSAMLLAAVLAHRAGRRACDWALRVPGAAGGAADAAPVARRRLRGSPARQLHATDRASVWRSPSLRRGLLVLTVLPPLVAAAAGLEWSSLVLLPAVVAAGTGLLFGVNVFCLDGAGALWLGSAPVGPRTVFWSKALLVVEVCAATTTCAVAGGALRADTLPTAGEAVATSACAFTTTLLVLSACMDWSVRRPHHAPLGGPRDAPAPPGAMADYSVRLALSTTLAGLAFSALAGVPGWGWPLALALPLCLLALRRLLASARVWSDGQSRARVLATVASG